MSTQPICVCCGRECECYKNEVYAETSTGFLQGDVFQCPSCGQQVLLTKPSVLQTAPEHAVIVRVDRKHRPGDRVVTHKHMLAAAQRVFPEAQVAQYGPVIRLSCGRLVRHFKILDIDANELAIAHANDEGRVILHRIK